MLLGGETTSIPSEASSLRTELVEENNFVNGVRTSIAAEIDDSGSVLASKEKTLKL